MLAKPNVILVKKNRVIVVIGFASYRSFHVHCHQIAVRDIEPVGGAALCMKLKTLHEYCVFVANYLPNGSPHVFSRCHSRMFI